MAVNKFSIQVGGKLDTQGLITQLNSAFSSYKLKINIDIGHIQSQINSALGGLGKAVGGSGGGAIPTQTQAINDYSDAYGDLAQRVTHANGVITDTYKKFDENVDTVTKIANATGEVTKETLNYESANNRLQKGMSQNQTQFDKLSSKVNGMTGTLGTSKKSVDSFKTQLGEITKLMGDKTPEGIEKASKALKNLGNEIQTVETRSASSFQTLSSAIGKFTAWYLIAGVVTTIISKFKDLVTQTIALDKAMTSLQMVTQYTDSQMRELKETYIELAQEMGVAVSTVTKGADEFLRAGLNATQANDALRASLVLSTVANMDSATSTKYLIAAMNAYKLEANELMLVVDKLSAVDIVAATSSEELGEALSLSASSAQLAGIELDKFLGMIATVSETTRQSASSIGNSFKTIFARMQQVKIGSLVDEDGENISNVSRVLSQYGINLMEVTDQMTDMGALFDLLGDKWNEYSTATRSELATTIAGVRQRDKFLVLMNNYNRALELSTVSTESAGSAQEKYNIYLESTEAKINKMESAWTELTQATLSSGMVEFFIELATSILKMQTAMGGLVPLITTTIGLFMIIKNYKTIAYLQTAVGQVIKLGKTFQVLTAEMQASAIASAKLQMAMGWITLALTLAYSAYSLIKTGIDNAKKAQEEYRESVVNGANTEIEALKKVRDEYEELSKIAKPTNEQQAEMEKILKSLGIAYDKAGLSADGYAQKLAEVNTATEEGLILNYRKIIESNRSAYEKAQEELSKEIKIKFSGDDRELGRELASIGVDIDSTSSFWEAFTGQNVKKIKGNYAEIVKTFEDAIEHYEKLMLERELVGKSLTEEESKGYEFVSKQLKQLQSQYETQLALITEVEEAEEALMHIRSGDYLDWISGKLDGATTEVDGLAESLSGLKDEFKKVASGMQALIDKRKEENDELKRQNELQEKSLAVEKARIALEEARNKKVRVFRAGQGFVDVSDTSGIQSAQEKLMEAQKDKAETEGNVAMERAKNFVNELSAVAESSDVITAWSSFYDKFGSLMGTEYEDYLIQAKTFVEDYKKVLSGVGVETETGTQSYYEQAKSYILSHGMMQGDKNRWQQDPEFRKIASGLTAEQWESLRGYTSGSAIYDGGKITGYEKIAPKYAKGTDSASGGLSMVGEKGAEMRVLNKGDGIIPSNITRNLMAIGSNPALLGKLVESNNSQVINVGRVEVNGISDVDGFIQELSLIASR